MRLRCNRNNTNLFIKLVLTTTLLVLINMKLSQAVIIGATATTVGTGVTEVLSRRMTKMHEALLVSLLGGLVTAASIVVADKVTDTPPDAARTWSATIVGMIVASIATFVVGYMSEEAGANIYIRGLLVGLTAGIAYVAVRYVKF